jgi:hypothetical protein
MPPAAARDCWEVLRLSLQLAAGPVLYLVQITALTMRSDQLA